MLATTRAAAATGAPLGSALTGGRDTRVLLALSRAAHADVGFYTSGSPEHVDVRIACRLAERFDLRHRVVRPSPPTDLDAWARQTTAFVARTDGLSPIAAISDHLDHDATPERLGLELWGGAGEIGRTPMWLGRSLAAIGPVARRSHELQRRMAQRAIQDPPGLLAPEAVELARTWLDGFVATRHAEGWPAEAITQTAYAFGRVRHWTARGVRRAAATTDLFSPFATEGFVAHCLSLPAEARYVEQPHRRLIAACAPEVHTEPYEVPWQPGDPRLALPALLRDVGRRVAARVRPGPTDGAAPPALGPRWFEAGLALHRDVALSSPSSSLWDVVDRRRYEALLAATPAERAPYAVSLGRVLAALWYLTGPGR
jgi:hypothetical protein